MPRMLVVLGVLCLAASARASEPSPPVLEPGARIRLTGRSEVHLPGLVEVENGHARVDGGRLLAQDADRILIEADGSTVLVPRAGRRVEGRLAAVEADAYVIEMSSHAGPEKVRVPRAAVSTIEVAGHASRVGHAFAGLVVGAAVGAAVGALSAGGCHPGEEFCSVGFNAGVGMILAAPVGLVVGAALPVKHWTHVSPEPAIALGVAPTRGHGVGASLSLRF